MNNMKNTKRILGFLLAIALVFLIVNPAFGPIKKAIEQPQAEVVNKSSTSTGVTFYVPETIYLKPVNGNATTFQYFVDRVSSVNGALDKTYNKASGRVYFNAPGATSVTISCSGHSSMTPALNWTGTSSVSQTITAGTVSGIAEGNTTVLTWTANYTQNGRQKTAKAYTVVYAPLVEPVASAIRTYNSDGLSDGIKAYLQAFTYATGVHSIATGEYGGNRSGGKVFAPMLGTITAPGNNGVTDWFSNSATRRGTNYKNREGGGDNIVVIKNSPIATLTVDTSRYSNIEQIPNFKYGLVITDTERMSGKGYWFVSDYTNGTYQSDGDESKDGGNLNAWWGTNGSAGDAGIIKDGSHNNNVGVSNGIKVGGQTGKRMFSKAISGTGTENFVKKGAAKMENGSEWNATINLVRINFTKVNKATLRTNVNDYIGLGLQASDFTNATDFLAYENAIKAASTTLGDPKATSISDTIGTAYNKLVKKYPK